MLQTDPPLAYNSALESRILDGDVTGVMDLIDSMDSTERSKNVPAVEQLIFNRWRMLRRVKSSMYEAREGLDENKANLVFRAIDMARFMCRPDMPQHDYWMHIGLQDIAAYKKRYAPTASKEPLEKQIRGENGWHYRHHVHRAVIAGLIERPQTEEYSQSLFFGDLRGESNTVLKHVDADPGVAPYLLMLFDREGTSDGSFAAVEKYCHNPELTWSHAFLTLCQRGVYTREQLLDKTLRALACDWPQFKSGWFSRFHEALAPTTAEMVGFAPRYLALCHSRIAPTVGLAADAVSLLYKAGYVDEDELCDAMQPVITSAVKGRVLSALDLLGQVVKRVPERAFAISALAAPALGHSGSDVQKKAIAYLQSWGLDSAGQEVARVYLPIVSAVNQAALTKLLGAVEAPAIATALAPQYIAQQVSVASAKVSPLHPDRAIHPLTQVPDLVEQMAYVFENLADVDAWERVADALVRMAPIPVEQHTAFSALKKRAKRFDWYEKTLGFALARLMACAVDDEATQAGALAVPKWSHSNAHSFIARRTLSLINQASLGLGLPVLSAPTHRGGFIDPRILVDRIAAYQAQDANASMSEQVFALMRLVPADSDPDAAQAAQRLLQDLKQQPIVAAMRHALGDTVKLPIGADIRPLFLAAARIRTPNADDAATLAAYGCLGPDGPNAATFDWSVTTRPPNDGGYVFHDLTINCAPSPQPTAEYDYAMDLCAKRVSSERRSAEGDVSHIRFTASLMPSGLEPFFAEGARALGNNLDWSGAEWKNRAYLDVLLEPTTAMTPMARLALGFALAGKEPGQTALAVDALTRSVLDGRLDIAAMGDTLARLWATPMVKGPRYSKSLAAAAQADASMPAAIVQLLSAMVVVNPTAPRKDLAPLLELLQELLLAHQLTLPASTVAVLATMRLSGKGKTVLQGILGNT